MGETHSESSCFKGFEKSDEIGSKNHFLSEEISKCLNSIETFEKSNDDILNGLLSSISPIDFEILAFPDIETVRSEMEILNPFVFNEDGTINKENKNEIVQYNKSLKQLKSYSLTKNHYLIICIEQLLKIAKINNWGLCKNNGIIYIYNGSYWLEVDKEKFQSFLGSVAREMGVEKFTAKIHTFRDELFKQFMADAYLPTPKVKGNTLINLQNGTFEVSLNKGVLRPFDKKDFITHQLPFEYDPETTAPLFQKYLDEVLPDKEKQKVLAEYCGYIFIKNGQLKLEKMLILYGTGANGKSVFFEILNALLGSKNISNYSLQSLTNENGYQRAKIGDKLVNYASEINGKLDTAIFKQLVAGEPIDGRLPYGEPFILSQYAKLIFNCNELPKDVEHTNAYFRRFLIIGFDVTIPEDRQDKQLSSKIVQNELSGVFNWILEGLDRLLIQKNFSKCDAIENARTNYEMQSDSVRLFISEKEYEPSASDYLLISEIYVQYKFFCVEDGYRPVGKSKFIQRLNHYKYFVERKSIGNVVFMRARN